MSRAQLMILKTNNPCLFYLTAKPQVSVSILTTLRYCSQSHCISSSREPAIIVRTPRNIPGPGKNNKKNNKCNNLYFIFCSHKADRNHTDHVTGSERPLSAVLLQFVEWLTSAVTHDSDVTSTVHCPGNIIYSLCLQIEMYAVTIVLVAHNGFSFNFPILMAEVENRDNLSLSIFTSNLIHFSDSLPLLRSVRTKYV